MRNLERRQCVKYRRLCSTDQQRFIWHGTWKLYKDKINKITTTKKYGRRYFRPLDADDVDNNTKDMEESIGKGYIITREVFGLNDKTKPYAER